MSKARIKTADTENNNYTVDVSGYGTVLAQCVTKDELSVGSDINIVDHYNKSPDDSLTWGNIRLLPNNGEYAYSTDKIWKTADELWAMDCKASLAYGFMFSSERNKRWQEECPLYKTGTVTSIIDEKQMNVSVSGMGTLNCRTDYMACDTAAFAEGDVVVIKFERCCKSSPVVVGFWDEPKSCAVLCTEITESDLDFDIAEYLSYEVDLRRLYAEYGTWTEFVDIDTSSGMSVDLDVLFERTYGETLPAPAVYIHWLRFMLSELIELEEGWYYLTYDFNTTPIIVSTIITPVSEWYPESQIQAETLCRMRIKNTTAPGYSCKFHGTQCKKIWTYDYSDPENPVEIVIDDFNECGDGYSGSYAQCIELKNENKGASIHTDALDIQIIMYSASSSPFDVDFEIRNAGIEITNLSLRKIKMEVLDPCDYGDRDCREDDSCVSPATWDGFYVGDW